MMLLVQPAVELKQRASTPKTQNTTNTPLYTGRREFCPLSNGLVPAHTFLRLCTILNLYLRPVRSSQMQLQRQGHYRHLISGVQAQIGRAELLQSNAGAFGTPHHNLTHCRTQDNTTQPS